MRKYILTSLLIVSSILFSICCKGYTLSDSDNYYLAYDGNFHDEIIKPEVQAWQKVAKVIYPHVCDDTEAQWAANLADSLANVLLSSPDLCNGEQVARLCEIENTIAYGMSYFSAIIGAYSNPEASEAARMMMHYSYADLDSLHTIHFNDARLLVAYEQSTFANFGLFMELGTQYSDGEPQFVANNQEMNALNNAMINILFMDLKDPIQSYRYSSIINNTLFFMTYCPMTFWLAGGDFQQSYQAEYIKIGGWFDEQCANVNKAIYDNDVQRLPDMSLDSYSRFEKQAAEYRARLIELLAEGIATIPLVQ